MAAPTAQAQTFQVLHAFTGGGDDAAPAAGLTAAAAGKFYGTTDGFGIGSNGSVFQLTSTGSSWLLDPLRNFGRSGNGPATPYSSVTIGPDGALYGTTYAGGVTGNGTVFELQPPTHACASFSCPWTMTVLHEFSGADGVAPYGEVVFDRAGNLYGTTEFGGIHYCHDSSCGVVYELSPTDGGWTETVIHDFSGSDGSYPSGGLLFDAAGNLYGVTWMGGDYYSNGGVLYKLSPSQGGGWAETILHDFGSGPSDGALPVCTLIMDGSGNLYGTTEAGGSSNGGTVFQMSQSGQYQVLYNFPANSQPEASLIFGSSGNLYGTTFTGGVNGFGTVFKLAPSHGGWIESDLHVFQASSDGGFPFAGVVFDSAGNLYGTAESGGHFSGVCPQGCGTVWEITP